MQKPRYGGPGPQARFEPPMQDNPGYGLTAPVKKVEPTAAHDPAWATRQSTASFCRLLEGTRLKPSPPAPKGELIRRIYSTWPECRPRRRGRRRSPDGRFAQRLRKLVDRFVGGQPAIRRGVGAGTGSIGVSYARAGFEYDRHLHDVGGIAITPDRDSISPR